MNRDYRIQPPKASARENMQEALESMTDRLIDLKELWPRPSDYHDLPRSWSKDLMAGLTVGVVALPLALGFGVASGAGAAAGLATAIIAGLVAAIFGGSHLQVSGPTGAMTVVLLPVIAIYGLESIPTLAIMAGVIVVLMGVLGMGRSVDLLPFPVVEGFTMGIGVIIALQQLPLLLGARKVEHESSVVSAWLTAAGTDWSQAWRPLLVAGFVVVIHLIGRRFWPNLPIALIAIIIATLAVELSGFDVARIGVLPSTLPAPTLPALDVDTLRGLIAPALAVAALAALESLLSARVADGMVPDLGRTQPNRELLGQGLANVASGLFGGLPATGAIARTAVNVRTGARTRLASISHAVVLLVIMLALGPLVARIPMAALGGVLVMVAVNMVSPATFTTLSRATRADRNTFWLTFVATVALDLVVAVLAGVAMAAIMSLRHMAAYTIVRRQHLPADTHEGLIDLTPEQEHLRSRIAIYRVDGALFYGNANRFVDEITSVEDVAVVIIRFHRMNVMDASGAEAVKDTVRRLERRGIRVIAQGMTDAQVRTASIVDAVASSQHEVELSAALARAVEKAEAAPEKQPPDTWAARG